MWDIYLENPNTYKMKTIELKKMQNIDRKLKNYTYKAYTSGMSPTRQRSSVKPTPDHLHHHHFFSRDLDSNSNRLNFSDRKQQAQSYQIPAQVEKTDLSSVNQNKSSELTKIHNKLRKTNLNDSQLNIFPGDLQNIVFEISDTDYEDEFADNSSNTDTFLDTDEASMPIPITLRVASLKRQTD